MDACKKVKLLERTEDVQNHATIYAVEYMRGKDIVLLAYLPSLPNHTLGRIRGFHSSSTKVR